MRSPRRVVGYLSASSPADAAPLLAKLRTAAEVEGVNLVTCYRDSVECGGAPPAAFGACLAAVEGVHAEVVLVASWEQLAPNSLLARALCHHLRDVGGHLYVAQLASHA